MKFANHTKRMVKITENDKARELIRRLAKELLVSQVHSQDALAVTRCARVVLASDRDRRYHPESHLPDQPHRQAIGTYD